MGVVWASWCPSFQFSGTLGRFGTVLLIFFTHTKHSRTKTLFMLIHTSAFSIPGKKEEARRTGARARERRKEDHTRVGLVSIGMVGQSRTQNDVHKCEKNKCTSTMNKNKRANKQETNATWQRQLTHSSLIEGGSDRFISLLIQLFSRSA